MYQIYNNVENKIVFNGNERNFLDFTKLIVIENMDYDYSVLGISDAIDYIEDYCDNLEIEY